MARTNIQVEGMSCEHCKKAIVDSVKDMEGLQEIEVFIDQGLVQVLYDPGSLDLKQVKDRIKEAGYRVLE